MSDVSCDIAEKGGRLIRFALLPRLLPSGDPEYLGLVREFLSNPNFQDMTSAVARGLGLRVLFACLEKPNGPALCQTPFRAGLANHFCELPHSP